MSKPDQISCVEGKNQVLQMGRNIITLEDLDVGNMDVFKKINQVSLPTTYPDQWYERIQLKEPTGHPEIELYKDQIGQFAYYSELPVGAIKARVISSDSKQSSYEAMLQLVVNHPAESSNAVYIESFAVLKAYRNLQIGSNLLKYLIQATQDKDLHEIVAHVPVDNSEGLDWLLKQKFVKSDLLIKDFYKEQGLENPDAYIVSLAV